MAIPLWRLIAGGLRSLIVTPPVGTGGTVSARYCYSVFMRHRVIAAQYGMTQPPSTVVELGPGDSLGIGLMAILTGSQHYIAIDAVRHANTATNLAVFDEVVTLLMNRTPIPFDGECAAIRPELIEYGFPHALFDQDYLSAALSTQRLSAIRQALINPSRDGLIQYYAPLGEMSGISAGSIDWIFSQAVLEHVDELEETYRQCFRCLRSGGFMTHQIDYQCHETAKEWNGHWGYPNWLWVLMRGRRPWFVNRLPHSVQRKLQEGTGFSILAEILQKGVPGIKRSQLSTQFRGLSDQDFVTAGAMLVSRKGLVS